MRYGEKDETKGFFHLFCNTYLAKLKTNCKGKRTFRHFYEKLP